MCPEAAGEKPMPEPALPDAGDVTRAEVWHGTRRNVGSLLVGLGGVLLDPPRVMLSVRVPGTTESEQCTLAVGETSSFAGHVLRLIEITAHGETDVAVLESTEPTRVPVEATAPPDQHS